MPVNEDNRKPLVTPQSFQFKPKAKGTAAKNPTVADLMGQTSDATWEWVRVPEVTKIGAVAFESIYLNKGWVFKPGQEYHLHPKVAAEVRRAIAGQEAAPAEQMSGNNKLIRASQAEAAKQREFEERIRAAQGQVAMSLTEVTA